MEVEQLLSQEGVEPHAVDQLLQWARRRAAELLDEADVDPDLLPLLADGERSRQPAVGVPTPIDDDSASHPSQLAALPQPPTRAVERSDTIPPPPPQGPLDPSASAGSQSEVVSADSASAQEIEEIEELDEVELLDDSELELVEDESPSEPAPEWQEALATVHESSVVAAVPQRPQGERLVAEEDELSGAHDLDFSDLDDET